MSATAIPAPRAEGAGWSVRAVGLGLLAVTIGFA